MPNLKQKMTILSILALGGANLYTASLAQNASPDYSEPAIMEPSPTAADFFAAADMDGDAALNMDEHRTYIDTLADAGDEAALLVRDGATYDAAFASADSDGDGMVTFLEATSEPQADMDETESESSEEY